MMRNDRDTLKRFSIRKMTIGAVSVMFGAMIFGVSTNQVQAAETPAGQTEQTTQTSADQHAGQDHAAGSQATDHQAAAAQSAHQDSAASASSAARQTRVAESTHQAAATDADYNKEVQKKAPALIQNPVDKAANAQTKKDDDGVTTEMSLSAKNKNTNETSEVKANTNLNKSTRTSDVNINTNTAKDLDFNITLHNTTEQNKNVSGNNYWYELPAWNGINTKVVVDANRLKRDEHGNIVFGGNYQDKGLTISNFDLAFDNVHSTGLSKTVQDASADPSKIGGFMVSGTIQAGDTATITIPLMVRDSEQEGAVSNTERIGVFSNKHGLNVRAAKVESDLDAQKGKKYFLVDTSKTSGNTYHEIAQSVINDLNNDRVAPTYQDGDIQINNFAFGEQNANGQTYLTAGGYVIYRNAVKRLNGILNKYGYQVDNVPGAGGVTNGDGAYALNSSLKFVDADGNPVQLGRGDVSNFFIPVKQIIKQSSTTASIVDYGTPQINVENTVKSMFSSQGGLVYEGIDNIDTLKPGAYQVTAKSGNISRTLNVIVVQTTAYPDFKASDSKHFDILPAQIISKDSLDALQANRYTITWAKDAQGNELKPTYDLPGKKKVTIAITDPDGRVYKTKSTVDVRQGINVHFVERTYDANGNLVSSKEDKTIKIYGPVGYANTIGWQDNQFKHDPDWQNLLAKGFSIDSIKDVKFLAQKDDQNVTVYVDHHEAPKKDDDTKPDNKPTTPTNSGDNTNPEPTVTPTPGNNTPEPTPVLPETTPTANDDTNTTAPTSNNDAEQQESDEPQAAPVHGQKAPTKSVAKANKKNGQKANKGATARAEAATVHAATVKAEHSNVTASVVKTGNRSSVKTEAKATATLPETGAKDTTVLGVVGMLLAGLGLFGLDRRKKRN